MKSTIAVGLEATIDAWITFPSLTTFAKFARECTGPLVKLVREGYRTVVAGKGDEVSIDGETKEAQELVRQAKEFGADVRYTLGGNGAQEAATLKALGSSVIFVGGISLGRIAGLPPESRRFLENVNFSFANISEEYNPSSYILQARGTNRYILCEGKGRRINQLRPYLRKLPSVLKQVLDKYGELDMVNLVGWQVLFANGISDRDFRIVKGVVKEVRNTVGSPLFTDAGGLASFDATEKLLLYRIYSLFDILSVNEDELLEISWALGAETKDEFRAMHNILESSERLSTIWFHSLDSQASLSTKYGGKQLEKAQTAAAIAGVYRVERGNYPTLGELAKRKKIKNYSKKGLKTTRHAIKKYGGKMGDAELVVTPCYKARNFTSTVGAGDVAAAAYSYVIAGGKI